MEWNNKIELTKLLNNGKFKEAVDFMAAEKEWDAQCVDMFKLIDDACKWWEDEFIYPSMTDAENEWYREKIEDFRKAMEEEK